MADYITISDDDDEDEEVQVLDHVRNCTPYVVDLTDSETPTQPSVAQNTPSQEYIIRQQQQERERQEAEEREQRRREAEAAAEVEAQRARQRLEEEKELERKRQEARRAKEREEQLREERRRKEQQDKKENEEQENPIPNPSPIPNQDQNQNTNLTDKDLMIAKKEYGNKLYKNNQLNDAVKQYREACDIARKLDDRNLLAILHFNLAMTYSKLGSYNQAIDECAAAVKIEDSYMKAHCKRAEIFMLQGKYDEAVICYEYICEIDNSVKDEAQKRISYAREMAKRSRKLDQHEILGLQPGFTMEELRKTYKKKARLHHPDRHSDADVVTRRIQEKIFKGISEAYAFFQKRYGFH